MRKATLLIALSVLVSIDLVPVKSAQDHFDGADKITRLHPSTFSQLPEDIVKYLNTQKCLVPQAWIDADMHNIVQGHFKSMEQEDWAVLCSRDGVSSILVFWGDSANSVSQLASLPDQIFLQDVGNGKMGYSRVLGIADEHFILKHYEWYGGPKPPPVYHEGIIDIYIEKASTVHYYYLGKWMKLQGAD